MKARADFSPTQSRRTFLKHTGGGLSFVLVFGPAGVTLRGPADGRGADGLPGADGRPAAEHSFGAWVRIATDGQVLIYNPAAEMGQGSMTALPVIVAEEMDADWDRVRIEHSPVEPTVYGRSWGGRGSGGTMMTVGSMAVRGYFTNLRLAGAQIRRVLLDNVAREWDVPAGELTTEPGVVVHASSGRRVSYGKIAAFARVPSELPEVGEAELKSPDDFRLIGHSVPRHDIPAKTDGSARYGMDVRVPGMLYGMIVRSPVHEARPASFNEAELRALPGVVSTVTLDYGRGRDRRDRRSGVRRARRDEHRVGRRRGRRRVRQRAGTGQLRGHRRPERRPGTHDLREWRRGRGDGGRGPPLRSRLLQRLRLPRPDGAAERRRRRERSRGRRGGVGRDAGGGRGPVRGREHPRRARGAGDLPPLLPGRRVRAAIDVGLRRRGRAPVQGRPAPGEADLDPRRRRAVRGVPSAEPPAHDGRRGWRRRPHRVGRTAWWATAAACCHRGSGFRTTPSRISGSRAAGPVTACAPNTGGPSGTAPTSSPSRPSSTTSPAASPSTPTGSGARSCGSRRGPWPYSKRSPRWPAGARVRRVDARGGSPSRNEADRSRPAWPRSRWTRPAAASAYTVFWCAVDGGIIVQPDNARAQIEGGIVTGLSSALFERVSVRDGRVEQSNYHDYSILRMSDMPEIDVRFIPSREPPMGLGEAGTPLAAGAVANAFAALTGRPLRHMPFSPERVLEALEG